jgi:hypothetical protein
MKLDRRMSQTVDLDEVIDTAPDSRYGPEPRLELIVAGEDIRRARPRPREARLVGLRAAGYSREQMAELTGDTYRTVDRQLGWAQGKLRVARRAEVGVR